MDKSAGACQECRHRGGRDAEDHRCRGGFRLGLGASHVEVDLPDNKVGIGRREKAEGRLEDGGVDEQLSQQIKILKNSI